MPHACPYCHAESRRLFVTTDRNRGLSDRPFIYYRCPACRLVFLDPIPEDLGDYYPADYYPIPTSLAEFREEARHQRFKLDLITPFATSGSLLEVGPAFGGFALLAKEAGFRVEALEMDSRCCRFLREVVGVETIESADTVASVRDRGPYDVIALWHVVEHLPDFGPVLDALASKVKPGGLLVVAAPNPDSLQFRLLGRYWAHTDAPRHVVLIPPALLVDHLRARGFSTIRETMTDPGGIGWNLFGWQNSLANFSSKPRGKALLSSLGAFLTRRARRVERNDRLGTAYTFIFRKDVSR